jgi:hypothetical protein
LLFGLAVGNAASAEPYSPYAGPRPPTRVFWGDTHHHTSNSGDAFTVGNRLGPETSYRFARGEEIVSSSGQPVRLSRPLDFLAVSDHAEGLGLGREIFEGNPALTADPTIRRWNEMLQGGRAKREAAAREIIQAQASGTMPKPITDPRVAGPIMRSVWQANNATAESFNEPGRFTAFIGYEWTSVPGGNNLHRVVLFRDGADKADQILPMSSHQSEDPARLWDFLSSYEEKTGGSVLAIPHNANISNGRMFALVDFEGNPIDREHAERRAHWEPVVEVTQIKGDGEAHPFLSPEDEFADFGDAGWEYGNLTLEAAKEPEMFAGEYAREALKRGLVFQVTLGRNPFKFGMIGATDAHTSVSAVEEASFFSKNPLYEPRAERATHLSKELDGKRRYGWHYNSAGFAGVWAHENTRESLFDALRRREVYATTGTRMTVRFFGGFDFVAEDAGAPDLAAVGYAKGVPMGGDLPTPTERSSPAFLVSALRDPIGANLDRVQIVKGFIGSDGEAHERIYDVAWGDAERRRPDADGKLPPVGSTVDVARATWRNTIGDPALGAVWQDPDFDPERPAFYYARVLEIPTPRWSTYDAVRYGIELPPEVPRAIQERAYTSPIWYTP